MLKMARRVKGVASAILGTQAEYTLILKRVQQ
jgi:hypothetical protein